MHVYMKTAVQKKVIIPYLQIQNGRSFPQWLRLGWHLSLHDLQWLTYIAATRPQTWTRKCPLRCPAPLRDGLVYWSRLFVFSSNRPSPSLQHNKYTVSQRNSFMLIPTRFSIVYNLCHFVKKKKREKGNILQSGWILVQTGKPLTKETDVKCIVGGFLFLRDLVCWMRKR